MRYVLYLVKLLAAWALVYALFSLVAWSLSTEGWHHAGRLVYTIICLYLAIHLADTEDL